LKIFDPYFTTKEKGSGLGLATSYSIVKNHGGLIEVSSKTGKGTLFTVYIPAAEDTSKDTEQTTASSTIKKGKILVMDDEQIVRDIAWELIRSLGHEVELARQGQEAIEKYRAAKESGSPFDIVILDLTIRGGMGGKETIEHLLAFDSNIKAIVSSGYSVDAVVSEYQKYGFKARLSKPYKIEELRDLLNVILS
jgi:CheY-like chemotaxis protein